MYGYMYRHTVLALDGFSIAGGRYSDSVVSMFAAACGKSRRTHDPNTRDRQTYI